MTEARIAACRLIKHLGHVPTFRMLYVVELALQAECDYQHCSLVQSAKTIFDGAMEQVRRGEAVDYFFFEDCRWRYFRLSRVEREEIAKRQIRRSWEGL